MQPVQIEETRGSQPNQPSRKSVRPPTYRFSGSTQHFSVVEEGKDARECDVHRDFEPIHAERESSDLPLNYESFALSPEAIQERESSVLVVAQRSATKKPCDEETSESKSVYRAVHTYDVSNS